MTRFKKAWKVQFDMPYLQVSTIGLRRSKMLHTHTHTHTHICIYIYIDIDIYIHISRPL